MKKTIIQILQILRENWRRKLRAFIPKCYQVKVFVPVVNVGDDHGPGGDGNSLVGVAVDDVDVLVALGRQDHGELPAVGGKDLYPTPKNLYLSGRVCFLQAFSKVQY